MEHVNYLMTVKHIAPGLLNPYKKNIPGVCSPILFIFTFILWSVEERGHDIKAHECQEGSLKPSGFSDTRIKHMLSCLVVVLHSVVIKINSFQSVGFYSEISEGLVVPNERQHLSLR